MMEPFFPEKDSSQPFIQIGFTKGRGDNAGRFVLYVHPEFPSQAVSRILHKIARDVDGYRGHDRQRTR